MRMLLRCTAGLLALGTISLVSAAPQAALFYASPSATGSGDGSIGSPWTLQQALDGPSALHPGDTVYLRGGSYNNVSYNAYVSGTSSAPIVFRAYPGERATIRKNDVSSTTFFPLRIYGDYLWFWGIEIRNDSPLRNEPFSPDCPGCRGVGVLVDGNADRLINMVVHDLDQGLGMDYDLGLNTEVYGSLVYNNGIVDGGSDGRGHGVYVQNSTGGQGAAGQHHLPEL
jgi:hypothetical protein